MGSGSNWLVQLVDVGSGAVLYSAPAASILDIGPRAPYGVFYATLPDVGSWRGRTVGTRVFNSDSEASATGWALFSGTTTLIWDTIPSPPATFTYNAGRVAHAD